MFYVIEGTMGFSGDDEKHIIEADSEDEACDQVLELLYERVEVSCLESFDNFEDAENYQE